MKSMIFTAIAIVYSIVSIAQNPTIPQNEFHLQAEITGISKGKAVLSYFNREGTMQKEYQFDNHSLNINLIEKDTLTATIRFLCDELTITTAKGIKQCPHLSFMIVPGETASLGINLEKGKVATVCWKEGGEISHDFIRLNYELLSQEEKSFNQLIVDNIIRGGDIRNYPKESEQAFNANKKKTMTFIRNHPNSYISLIKLAEHYDWFDENEVERIFNDFSEELKHNSYSKAITQRLEQSKNYRTGRPASNFEKKDMNGNTISLENLKGKYVLLDFWGSWCGACRESHPHLKELYQKYKEQVVFINVAQEHSKNIDEARKLWQTAVKEDGLTWIQILNNEDREKCDMLRLFNIRSFPTKILIDPNGIIIARLVGGSANIDEILEKTNLQ